MIQNINSEGLTIKTVVGSDYTNVATINATGLGIGMAPSGKLSLADGTDINILIDRTSADNWDTGDNLIGDITFRGPGYLVDSYDYVKMDSRLADSEGNGRFDIGLAMRGISGTNTPGLTIRNEPSNALAMPMVGIGDIDNMVSYYGADEVPGGTLHVRSHSQDILGWQIATNVGPEHYADDPVGVVNQADWTRNLSVYTREDCGSIGDGADMTVVGEADTKFYAGRGYVWASTNYTAAVSYMDFHFDSNGVAVIAQAGDMSNSDFAGKLSVVSENTGSGVKLKLKNNLGSNARLGYSLKYWENVNVS